MSLATSSALSALAVAQRLAEVSSHNIANANTPGYTRKIAVVRPSIPVMTTAGLMGTGVTIESIVSVRDHFLSLRINAQQSGLGNTEILSRTLSELENILVPGPDTGLGQAIDDFFRAVNELSTNAQGAVSRESLVQSAGALCGVFRSTTDQLGQLRSDLRNQYDHAVDQINSYLEQIVDLNGRIMALSSGSNTASDLVDQRDRIVEQLSRIVPIQVAVDGNVSNILLEGRLVASGTDRMAVESDSSDGRIKLQIQGTTDTFDTTKGLLGGLASLYELNL